MKLKINSITLLKKWWLLPFSMTKQNLSKKSHKSQKGPRLPIRSPKPLLKLCPKFMAGPRRRNTSPNTKLKENSRNKLNSKLDKIINAFLCLTDRQQTKYQLMMIAIINSENLRKDSKRKWNHLIRIMLFSWVGLKTVFVARRTAFAANSTIVTIIKVYKSCRWSSSQLGK